MPDDFLDALLSISRFQNIARGEPVFHINSPAQSIYKVIEGEVHLYRDSESGTRVLLHRAYAGHYFAEASLNSSTYHCTAEGVKASRLQVIDARKMLDLLQKEPVFASAWIFVLSSELRRQRASVSRLHLKSAEDRIRHYIFTEGDTDARLQIQGSLSELSDILGLSRESLYRTLSRMEKAGMLERSKHSIKLI